MADAAVSNEWHSQVDGVLHLADNYLLTHIHPRLRDIEIEFVMDLHDHGWSLVVSR